MVNPSALSITLYAFQFEKLDCDLKWDENRLNFLIKMFTLEKLKLIKENIDSYLCNKDIDLATILPSAKLNSEKKEQLLIYISEGISIILDKETPESDHLQ